MTANRGIYRHAAETRHGELLALQFAHENFFCSIARGFVLRQKHQRGGVAFRQRQSGFLGNRTQKAIRLFE